MLSLSNSIILSLCIICISILYYKYNRKIPHSTLPPISNDFTFNESPITSESLPIIYRDELNIRFFYLHKLHPFDSEKYMNIYNLLKTIIKPQQFVSPKIVNEEFLLKIHTKTYLESIKSSQSIASIAEFPPFKYFPYFIIYKKFIFPNLYAVGATVLGGELALHYKWAIALSGGFHHASSKRGGGWCTFSDIPLAIKYLYENKKIKKAMIIDLDAHQGNGHERDKLANLITDNDEENIFILDAYIEYGYPYDLYARKGININIGLEFGTTDETYLQKIKTGLEKSKSFDADIIFYIAGSDILEGDPIGGLSITKNGMIQRDELIFEFAFERNIPIVMTLGGGYQKSNAKMIFESLKNLNEKFDIFKNPNMEKLFL